MHTVGRALFVPHHAADATAVVSSWRSPFCSSRTTTSCCFRASTNKQSTLLCVRVKCSHLSSFRICPNFSCALTRSPDTWAAINDNSPAITVEATSCDSNTAFTGCLFYTSRHPLRCTFINSMHACWGARLVPPPIVPTSIAGIVTDMYSAFSSPFTHSSMKSRQWDDSTT